MPVGALPVKIAARNSFGLVQLTQKPGACPSQNIDHAHSRLGACNVPTAISFFEQDGPFRWDRLVGWRVGDPKAGPEGSHKLGS